MGVGEWIDPLADIHLRLDWIIYFRHERQNHILCNYTLAVLTTASICVIMYI